MVSQQQNQSQQSQQSASQSHHSPGGSGREQREQRNSRSSRRKGSDSSVPEEDKDRREETAGRGKDKHPTMSLKVLIENIEVFLMNFVASMLRGFR